VRGARLRVRNWITVSTTLAHGDFHLGELMPLPGPGMAAAACPEAPSGDYAAVSWARSQNASLVVLVAGFAFMLAYQVPRSGMELHASWS